MPRGDELATANFEANVKPPQNSPQHNLDTCALHEARGVGDSPVLTTIFWGSSKSGGADQLNWPQLRRVEERRLRPHE